MTILLLASGAAATTRSRTGNNISPKMMKTTILKRVMNGNHQQQQQFTQGRIVTSFISNQRSNSKAQSHRHAQIYPIVNTLKSQQQSRRIMSLASSSSFFEKGDIVNVNIQTKNAPETFVKRGIVKERKNGGWYSVQLNDDNEIVKCRASRLSLATATAAAKVASVKIEKSFSLPLNPQLQLKQQRWSSSSSQPIIIDLDVALQEEASLSKDPNTSSQYDPFYIQQLQNLKSYTKFITFTDLHVSPSTLSTSIAALEHIHNLAMENDAAILFLGDFWHHRGTIRVDCLNAILRTLSKWEAPMIMIPGNHDQVTLGGEEHGLTVLENSYRVTSKHDSSKTHPGPLIFTKPTKFNDAFFIPYIRNNTLFQQILQSTEAKTSSALFIHADIKGAKMNDLWVSDVGVDVNVFPSEKLIYSGHFHKPQNITKTRNAKGDEKEKIQINYIGSPYQVSLSEANQDKFIKLLDVTQNWNVVKDIPINVGKKHYRVDTIEDLMNMKLHDAAQKDEIGFIDGRGGGVEKEVIISKGDRVVVSIPKWDIEQMRRNYDNNASLISDDMENYDSTIVCQFDGKIHEMRKLGVSVEVREIVTQQQNQHQISKEDEIPAITATKDRENEDASPTTMLKSYLTSEVERNAITNETANEYFEAGSILLEELMAATINSTSEEEDGFSFSSQLSSFDSTSSGTNGGTMELALDNVTIKGFGSFLEEVTYPLRDRGLVLLRGTNKDGGGSDSNGSGKSTLAMSTLWSLTGSVDPRPMQDARVVDIIHDSSKSAKVSVQGTVNSIPFIVSRTKTSSGGSLSFHLDGQDLTRQSIKETQAIIDEQLGATREILARTIFHGQHSINGLLEATDAKWKEELSHVVPLEMWRVAASHARSAHRKYMRQVDEISGKIQLRSDDVDALSRQVSQASSEAIRRRDALNEKKSQVKEKVASLLADVENSSSIDTNEELNSYQIKLDEASLRVEESETSLRLIVTKQDQELQKLRSSVEEIIAREHTARKCHRESQRKLDRAEFDLSSATSRLIEIQSKWNVDTTASDTLHFTPPEICPTCKQPVQSDNHHMHEELKASIKDEVDTAQSRIEDAKAKLSASDDAHQKQSGILLEIEKESRKALSHLNESEIAWKNRINVLKEQVRDARKIHARRSNELSDAAKRVQRMAEVNSIVATAEAEVDRFTDALNTADATHKSLQRQLEEITSSVKKMESRREQLRRKSAVMSGLVDAFGSRGIQTYLLKNAVNLLQAYSQFYLNELSDNCQKLDLILDSGDRISRSAGIRGPDGSWMDRPLSSLSGGQWRRCSLSLSLGFSDLVAQRGRLRPSLLVLDEPLTHLDASGRSHVGKVLRRMIKRKNDSDNEAVKYSPLGGLRVSTILIILQDLAAEELEESFDQIDEVIKKEGKSLVVTEDNML